MGTVFKMSPFMPKFIARESTCNLRVRAVYIALTYITGFGSNNWHNFS